MAVFVAVAVEVGASVCDGVNVAVADGEAVGVCVGVKVAVTVDEAEAVAVDVKVALGVKVEVAVGGGPAATKWNASTSLAASPQVLPSKYNAD